jgi:hypothetical protein
VKIRTQASLAARWTCRGGRVASFPIALGTETLGATWTRGNFVASRRVVRGAKVADIDVVTPKETSRLLGKWPSVAEAAVSWMTPARSRTSRRSCRTRGRQTRGGWSSCRRFALGAVESVLGHARLGGVLDVAFTHDEAGSECAARSVHLGSPRTLSGVFPRKPPRLGRSYAGGGAIPAFGREVFRPIRLFATLARIEKFIGAGVLARQFPNALPIAQSVSCL